MKPTQKLQGRFQNLIGLIPQKAILIGIAIGLGIMLGFLIQNSIKSKSLTEQERIVQLLKKHNKYKGFTPPASDREFWKNVTPKPKRQSPTQTDSLFNNILDGTIQECFYATGKWLPLVEKDLKIVRKLNLSDPDVGHYSFVDISSTSWAANIAHTIAMLGDQLDPTLVQELKAKVKNDVINPYLRELNIHPLPKYPMCPWLNSESNWTAVCHANIIYAILVIEDDVQKQAMAIEGMLNHIEKYFNSFDEDGHTRGGIRYWSFGIRHFLLLAERLLHATGGEINLYEHPKVAKMLSFPEHWQLPTPKVQTQFSYYPVFGDNQNPILREEMVFKIIGQRTDSPNPINLDEIWATNKAWAIEPITSASIMAKNIQIPKLKYFPKTSKDYIGRGSETTLSFNNEDPPTMALATKGGSNAEEHNHNDLGSYILFEKNKAAWDIVAGDQPNAGYPKDYYGPKKYLNPLNSSYGHPTPVIDNTLQDWGWVNTKIVHYISDDEKVILVYDLQDAYPVRGLRHALRLIYWDKKTSSTVILDKVIGDRPIQLETGIIIPNLKIDIEDNKIDFVTRNNNYNIEIDTSTPSVINQDIISCISWDAVQKNSAGPDAVSNTPKNVARIGIKNHIPQKESWIWYRISPEKLDTDGNKRQSPITITENNSLGEIPKKESINLSLKILKELSNQ